MENTCRRQQPNFDAKFPHKMPKHTNAPSVCTLVRRRSKTPHFDFDGFGLHFPSPRIANSALLLPTFQPFMALVVSLVVVSSHPSHGLGELDGGDVLEEMEEGDEWEEMD